MIVQKLAYLDGILKELKMLEGSQISLQTLRVLSRIEDKFIGYQ